MTTKEQLRDEAREVCVEAIASARDACDTAIASAWKVYQKRLKKIEGMKS